MHRLRLAKGRSYTGYGVTATALAPDVEAGSKKLSDALIATGRFVLAGETKADTGADDRPVGRMTEKELDVYAAENGIDLAGLTKKADKLARVQEALANAGDGGSDGGDGEGDGADLFGDEN
jgi:hypothetical protein